MHRDLTRTRPGRWAVVAAAVLALLATAAPGPAAAAGTSARHESVTFQVGATIRANGAAAVVRAVVTCFAPDSILFEVNVQQPRPHQRWAQANGFIVGGPCTGHPQVVTTAVPVTGAPEDAPFAVNDVPLHPGAATAQAFEQVCTDVGCFGRLFPRTSITLVDSARLDHPAGGSSALAAHGRLRAGGASVDAYVKLRCPAGASTTVDVTLYQTTSVRHVESGPNVVGVTCTGALQTVPVRIAPTAGPFVPGVSFVQAFVGSDVLWREVTLH